MEASASSGFSMAVAQCHFFGWNGLKEDKKKAFDMCVKIEKKTNGYHWTQYILGICYQHGLGVGKDAKKSFEYFSLSTEQGNSSAMVGLASCYDRGLGTDKNRSTAFEWYEKSANLGYCTGMCSVGVYYYNGTGVTKDLNKAREWYTKALAQGFTAAQTRLDKLNAQ